MAKSLCALLDELIEDECGAEKSYREKAELMFRAEHGGWGPLILDWDRKHENRAILEQLATAFGLAANDEARHCKTWKDMKYLLCSIELPDNEPDIWNMLWDAMKPLRG